MADKRKIEIFSAECLARDETVQMVNAIACPSCDVQVLDMRQEEAAAKAKEYGVKSVPAIVSKLRSNKSRKRLTELDTRQSKIMDCCCSGVKMSKETPQNACGRCGEIGRIVARQTVMHHVKSEKLSSVGDEEYKFCSSPKCPVVYYSASGGIFTVDDVRELIISKTEGDARPLCYCFGFTEGFARQEIAQTGESSVSKQVSQFIKEKLCSCEIRNPAGVCCLSEVNKAIRRLLIDSAMIQIPRGI